MTPTPEQIAKLPKWAQAHIHEITSENERLKGLPDAPVIPLPDLPPPPTFAGLTRGWSVNMWFARAYDQSWQIQESVKKGCSSSVHHGTDWARTSSQGARTLYSTERRAWDAVIAQFLQWAAQRHAELRECRDKASDNPYGA